MSTEAQRQRISVLFVGAHSDDIEIATGGTVAKLVQAGHRVQWLILTEEADPDIAFMRKEETYLSASQVGIPRSSVYFFDAKDTQLHADGDTVKRLRQSLHDRGIDVDAIFVHCEEDSHNDHVQAHRLIKSTFRKKVILCYYVVNSGVSNRFHPEVYVDTTAFQSEKIKSLKCHKSQSARISLEGIKAQDTKYKGSVMGQYCESYSVIVQDGAERVDDTIRTLNDCRFTSLWQSILAGTTLTIIYGRTVPRVTPPGSGSRPPSSIDVDLEDRLRKTFQRRFRSYDNFDPDKRILTHQSTLYNDEEALAEGSALIIGGTAANNATLRVFNHLPGLRYQMGHDMPYYKTLFIQDVTKRRRIGATYVRNEEDQLEVSGDYGLLTIIPNIYHKNGLLIGAMGIHGLGTRAIGRILCCEEDAPDIQDIVGEVRSGAE